METIRVKVPEYKSQKVVPQSIHEEDGVFLDRDFPPKSSSLYNVFTSKLHRNELRIWKEFTWKRPIEWMEEEPQLFAKKIDPDNLIEGYLGNSYFISALRALAEDPENITRLFDTKTPTEEGQYIINMCLNGENFKVQVDDYFPYCDKTKKPAFIRSKKNELWPMLLEKAWAKISGNYENSIEGLCCESFRALTGAPVEYLPHKSSKEVWRQLCNSFSDKSIVCAMAEKETQFTKAKDFDLFSAYAYRVTNIYESETPSGMVKLVEIKKPLKHKWLNLFGDTSKYWKKKMDTELHKDSILIKLEDYISYFKDTLICAAN